jgi:hypothetical protein
MSMSPEGPGWWQASDGRWYPPEQHPSATPPPGFTTPTPQRSGPPWGLLIGLAVLVVVLFGGAAIWMLSVISDEGDAAFGGVGGDTSVYDLRTGDCFDDPTMFTEEFVEVESIDSVPCDQLHDAEVYAVVDLPQGADAAFPGDDEVAMAADEMCLDRFEAYVGTTYEDSTLDINYYLPIASSWAEGDRMITCLLIDVDGEQLRGSMKGTGR